jgi:glycosyltransferase involved in cell wall biosynthesis
MGEGLTTVPTPRLSIALVTRNRPRYLRRCLESFRSQNMPPFEILISDDSTAFEALDQNRRLAHEFGCHYVAGPKRGLYANRNHAINMCSGSHVLTSDDDHTHEPDYLEKVTALIEDDPSRIWSIGEKYSADSTAPLHTPGEYGLRGNARPVKNLASCAAIADGSTVYPREVFTRARYDESYRFGDLYLLLGRELQARGWTISIAPHLFVYHHIESNQDRATDRSWMMEHLEANQFVRIACALAIFRQSYPLCRAVLLLLRSVVRKQVIQGYEIGVRLSPVRACRAMVRGLGYACRMKAEFTRVGK